jgi:hypothetical protein
MEGTIKAVSQTLSSHQSQETFTNDLELGRKSLSSRVEIACQPSYQRQCGDDQAIALPS